VKELKEEKEELEKKVSDQKSNMSVLQDERCIFVRTCNERSISKMLQGPAVIYVNGFEENERRYPLDGFHVLEKIF